MTWRKTTLGALCLEGGGGIQTGPFGSQLHASDYVPNGIPSVMPQNIGDNVIHTEGIAQIQESDAERLSKYRIRKGDIVYSRRGDVEKRALVRAANEGWLCGTGCLRVRLGDNSPHDPAFLSYLLGTAESREWIVRHAVGATMPNLNTSILSAVPLEVPEPSVQQTIAAVLGSLDDKIAANFRLITKVGEVLEAVFTSICGQPKEMIPFRDIATITKGVSYRSADLRESTTALVTLKSFNRNGGYSLRGIKEYAGPFKASQQIAPGELVVAQTDLTQAAEVVGRAVRVPAAPGYEKLVASLDLAIVRPRQNSPIEFLLGVMLQERFRAHCRSRTSGTTVLHLASDAIPSFQAPSVSQDVQENYASVAQPMLQLRDSLEYEIDSLASTRDALLPQLMSGKLRIKDAEKVLEDAGV